MRQKVDSDEYNQMDAQVHTERKEEKCKAQISVDTETTDGIVLGHAVSKK